MPIAQNPLFSFLLQGIGRDMKNIKIGGIWILKLSDGKYLIPLFFSLTEFFDTLFQK